MQVARVFHPSFTFRNNWLLIGSVLVSQATALPMNSGQPSIQPSSKTSFQNHADNQLSSRSQSSMGSSMPQSSALWFDDDNQGAFSDLSRQSSMSDPTSQGGVFDVESQMPPTYWRRVYGDIARMQQGLASQHAAKHQRLTKTRPDSRLINVYEEMEKQALENQQYWRALSRSDSDPSTEYQPAYRGPWELEQQKRIFGKEKQISQEKDLYLPQILHLGSMKPEQRAAFLGALTPEQQAGFLERERQLKLKKARWDLNTNRKLFLQQQMTPIEEEYAPKGG